MSDDIPKIPLRWGQTPWDDLSRDELLREVQRMYSAITSMLPILQMLAAGSPEGSGPGSYWHAQNWGGQAIAKGQQVRDRVESAFDRESLYRGFYRYADDLLFDGLGSGWAVCDQCRTLLGLSGTYTVPCL